MHSGDLLGLREGLRRKLDQLKGLTRSLGKLLARLSGELTSTG